MVAPVPRIGIDVTAAVTQGGGIGRYTRELLPHAGSYVALERSPAMLALARRRFADGTPAPRFLCANAERMPFADRSPSVMST